MKCRPFGIASTLSVAFLFFLVTITPAAAVPNLEGVRAAPAVSLSGVGFLSNQGQFSAPEVRFQAALPRAMVFVTGNDITYDLFEPDATDGNGAESRKGWVIKERPVGGAAFDLKPLETAETAVSFFKGRPEKWLVNLPAHKRLDLGETAPGIRVELALRNGSVEKIFEVAPGAEPQAIRFEVEGAERLEVNADGELEILTGLRVIRWSRPVAYQWIEGRKEPVTAAYSVSENRYGFTIGAFSREHPLVIDPLLACAGFGGAERDVAFDVVIASGGDVYVAGMTQSADFPTTAGAYVTPKRGSTDVFAARLDQALTTLKAAAIIGGTELDGDWPIDSRGAAAVDLALDSAGNVFLGFGTYSKDCPVLSNSWDKSHAGSWDGYVCKLNANLAGLLGATYFGGGSADKIYDLAVDGQGNVFVVGYTASSDMPTTEGAYDRTYNESYHYYAGGDAFAAKFDNGLTNLLAATYLGGSLYDYTTAMALDNSSNVYVAGYTESTTTSYPTVFPTTSGAFQTELTGTGDGFVSILDNSLATLSTSTYLGGTTGNYPPYDEPLDIALGPAGEIAVTGRTYCSDFPVTLGAYQMIYKGYDGFVSILKPDLTDLVASTYLGASGEDIAYSLDFDGKGNVWVGGQTFSYSFPVLFADQGTYGGGDGDAFLTQMSSDLQQLTYSSYLGGTSFDGLYTLTVDSDDKIVGAGLTYSANFPFTQGAYQSGDVGGTAFVSRFEPPQILTVDLQGSSIISPGAEGSFVVSYLNGMDEEAQDVVVVISLPRECGYQSSTGGGIYYPGGCCGNDQVFWSLGDLVPGARGEVTFTVKVPWGTKEAQYYLVASIGARNFAGTSFDIDEYLNYTPWEASSASTLSETQINSILSQQPSLKQLFDYLMGQGYWFFNNAVSIDLKSGESFVQLLLFAPKTANLTIITLKGNRAYALTRKNGFYEIFDATGGMAIDSLGKVEQAWGKWAQGQDGSSSSSNQPLPSAEIEDWLFLQCILNCAIKEAVLEELESVWDKVAMIADIGKECIPCANVIYEYFKGHATNAEVAKQCIQCGTEIAYEIVQRFYAEIVGEWLEFFGNLGNCLNDCRDNPTSHACIFGSVLVECCPSLISDNAVCHRTCYTTFGYGIPYTEEVCASNARCMDGACIKVDDIDNYKRGKKAKPVTVAVAHDPNAKSVDVKGSVLPGQTLSYTIECENVGQGTAYGVFIFDTLDQNLDESTLVIGDGGEYIPSLRLLSWDIGDLPPCTQADPSICKDSVTFSVKVKQGASAGTEIVNYAQVHFPSANEITPTNPVVLRVQTISAVPITVSTLSGQPVQIKLEGRAAGGGGLSYDVLTTPPFGALSGSPPSLVYTSSPQFSGQDEFYYVVKSGSQSSIPARVTINVSPDPADQTAPGVLRTVPEPGELNLHVDSTPFATDPDRYRPTISVTFSEAMDPASISGSTFTIAGLTGDVSYDAQLQQADFVPRNSLTNTTTYTARVATGAKDLAGNGLAEDYVWTFTTEGPDKLIYVSASPTTGGTVSGGGTYSEGENVTVIATAKSGWIFMNWTEDGVVVSTSATYTFSAEKSRDLVANFKLKGVEYLTHYVSKTAGCGGKTPCYASIQAAIDAATDGDVIWVRHGDYLESVMLNASKGLKLSCGWDDGFQTRVLFSSVNALRIQRGTLIVENLLVQKGQAALPDDLLAKAFAALSDRDILTAKGYFESASLEYENQMSNDADTARFFCAFTRLISLWSDIGSDGSMNNGLTTLDDILDAVGLGNGRSDPCNLTESGFWPALPSATSPPGMDFHAFLYDVVRPEIEGVIQCLDAISPGFSRVWTEPFGNTTVEIDYGDVLYARGIAWKMLGDILIQTGNDLDIGIASAINDEAVTVEDFLRNHPNFPTLANGASISAAELCIQRGLNDIRDAIHWIQSDTDDQAGDLIKP